MSAIESNELMNNTFVNVTATNLTDYDDTALCDNSNENFIFDRTDVKVIFITIYLLVFFCCFFGNLLVILVVTMSRRLRSITNFFLANLAVADFCVGVFCIMQNLSTYLIDSWVLGEFLCKMQLFVSSLSYIASVFILVVICMERYFAIIHPITCRQILTPFRLRLVIVGVWITSALYAVPKFIFARTIPHSYGCKEEVICILDRKSFDTNMFDQKMFDSINFGLLYVLPLLIITILYSRIAIALWKSSRGLERNIQMQPTSSRYEKRAVGATESQVSVESDRVVVTTWRTHSNQRHGTQLAQISHSTKNVLRARRGVIRMLIIVVLTFVVCNLPYHARKLWQHWGSSYKGNTNFTTLLTPLTLLATYINSGVNPLLYAFLSRNFRKGMRELILCTFKKSKKQSLQQRVTIHSNVLQESGCVGQNSANVQSMNHSLPTDSTHVGNPL